MGTRKLATAMELKLIQMWLHGKSPDSRRSYMRDIQDFLEFTHKPIEQITIADIIDWDSALALRYAPTSRKRKLAAIKSLFSFAHKNELISTNPGAAVPSPKTKDAISERILTEDEWERMLYAEPNRQHQLMLTLLYETRARVSEFCALKWKDIREKPDGAALVTLFGKGNKTRKVTITPQLWQVLKATKAADAKGDSPLFLNYRHKAYSTVQVWRIVKAAGERVGIYGVSPHWIRHTGATHQLINGSPLHLQQQELGHSGLNTTSKYLHILPGDYGAQYTKVKLPF
ncbi:tyrosine-type recombinase/integrase [Gloeothece verrucosa]|uniref:Integrase family protein n=1 Tax=Gloeothece verrucosa (strain PCC 7822) TaxID=497965 RepID=E0UNV0_GLOV7|nr:tyrosine-type recombinase/integrase [Gloeothece verrucosa]ADN18630.1 integrase family protein [Gloeothece verrucosa PCC 7822]